MLQKQLADMIFSFNLSAFEWIYSLFLSYMTGTMNARMKAAKGEHRVRRHVAELSELASAMTY